MTEHSERYWEARWRDEKAENERLAVENELLKAALREIEDLEWAIGPMAYREIARRAREGK
jgi:hypothetical protein